MQINWQDIFYFTASLVMIATLIICIWFMWLFFVALKLIRNLRAEAQKWNRVGAGIQYIRKGITLKVLGFLLKILDKKG